MEDTISKNRFPDKVRLMATNPDIQENMDLFVKLLSSNQKWIYAYILSMIPNYNDADDLMQETSSIMWKKFNDFQPGTDFVKWGIKIAHYQILNFCRKKSKSPLHFNSDTIEILQDTCENVVMEFNTRQEALRNCFNKLSSDDQGLLQVHYYQSTPVKVIAHQFGQTVQNIYQKLTRIECALLNCIRHMLAAEQ